jgi:putative ABC transport system permease protein
MLQDIRFAMRQLWKNPGFSVVAVLMLALAIGADSTIFSAVDAVLLHPLPYPDPSRLVVVTENLPHYRLTGLPPSFAEFLEYRRLVTSFSSISAVAETDATLTGTGHPETVKCKRITSAVFPMIGIKPMLGNLFTKDDEEYGNRHVVILSQGLWQQRYGKDPTIVGKYIQIDRESYRVAAVINPILDFAFKADLWMPLAFPPAESAPGASGPHNIDVIGRLKPNTTIEQARDEFRRIAARMVELYPNQDKKSLGFSIDITRLSEQETGNLKKPLYLLMGAVGALLLLACANVSNLLLARGSLRRKEIGLRVAVGASRKRLVRQLLTESLLLALVAGAGGLVLTFLGLRLYAHFAPEDVIPGVQPAVTAWVAGFSLLILTAAGIAFGLGPAISASGLSVNEALKEKSHGSTAGQRLTFNSIVTFEIAGSLVLLIATGLLVGSFVKLERTSPGFQPKNVLLAIVSLPVADYPLPAQRMAFERSLLDRARALPGIASAAITDFPPFAGGIGSHVEIEGQPQDSNKSTYVVYQTFSSSDYFETLQIPLLKGRRLSSGDDGSSLPVCDIDQTVASKFFPNSDAIGMRILLPIPQITCRVVGIVGGTKHRSLSRDPAPRIYYSSVIAVPQVTLVIKAVRNPLALVPALRHQILALNPNMPVTALTMEQVLADSVARQRFSMQLMTIFAGLAMLLTAIGIYGVLAYFVEQRRSEFGIRMALGARPGNVVGLVLLQGSIPLAVGLMCGLAGALGMTRYVKSLLYEVKTTDSVVFSSMLVGVIFISFLAMLLPAHRATRVDPLAAIREE